MKTEDCKDEKKRVTMVRGLERLDKYWEEEEALKQLLDEKDPKHQNLEKEPRQRHQDIEPGT